MQADKTISDLSKKLSERKKLLRKFNSEIKRLQKEIGNYKVLVGKYKSNKEGDEVRNDSQDVVITLKKKCAQYEASIDELKNRNKKLQSEIDEQKIEIDLNNELEEKMNALHRDYSILQQELKNKSEDYDELKKVLENSNGGCNTENEEGQSGKSTSNSISLMQIELNDYRKKLKFKHEEYETMLEQLEKAKKRRVELDEIVKNTKESLYDVQDQKESVELKLNRTLEEKERLEGMLKTVKVEQSEQSIKLSDYESQQKEKEERFESEIKSLNMKLRDFGDEKNKTEKELKDTRIMLQTEKEQHNALKNQVVQLEERVVQYSEESDDLKAKLSSKSGELNSVKTHLDESREKALQNIIEKDKLFHECEELKDEMTRHGSDIELNVVKGELRALRMRLSRLKYLRRNRKIRV